MAQSPVEAIPVASSETQVRSWRVLHACERVTGVTALAEAQSAVGMKPQVLAREFWSTKHPSPPSLMTTWNDVRDWRHALNEAEQLSSVHIVHAHSFAAAIAGVRGSLPSVYDFSQTVEEITTTEGASAGAWLLRSFRVAEQFALSRASAVVTHAQSMARLACERGTSPENVFVVPDPFPIAAERLPDRDWAAFHGIDLGYHSVLFALPSPDGVEATLLALAEVLIEVEQAILLFELSDADRTELLSIARQINVADNIRCIAPQEHDQAVDCSDVILIPATSDPRIRTNPAMLEAMAAGKAVVAADVPENRECSPDGHGVIWFNRGDTEDLAQRAAFVARNSDFSRTLGESGRSHIVATRSPQVIGRRYDNIYKYALSRRRDNLPKIPMPQLYTANVRA